ncbi:MAG: phage tail protein [Pyrinomonadaceae bacterium]|nr:phage tail protein [Pyrinomonadaceae bacterium]
MGTPYLGEIKIISWNFAPKGWAFCNGQLLPINQNQALFSILGTTYGGNGQTNFALPDFRSRIPISFGEGYNLGQAGGEEFHTVIQSEMPAHNHFVNASTQQADTTFIETAQPPSNNVFGTVVGGIYGNYAALTSISPETISNVGGSQPHENRQPYLVLNFIIALQGVFPSRN